MSAGSSFGQLQYCLFGSFLNFTMACETPYSNALQGSRGWGGKFTFVPIVCTGFAKLLQWLPVIAFAVNSCLLSCKPFAAIAISDWFRQFYFPQKMRITKMKTPLKSRSLFVLDTRNKKRIPFSDSLLWKPKKVPPFLVKSRTLLGFVFDILWTNFLE